MNQINTPWERRAQCAAEGHPQAAWCRQRVTNGAEHFCYFCSTCERQVTREVYADQGARGPWVTREFVAALGVDVDSVPVVARDLYRRRCQRCQRTALCEDHHWAPQAIFGPDAGSWPVGPLCADCHRLYSKTLEQYIERRIARALQGKAVLS